MHKEGLQMPKNSEKFNQNKYINEYDKLNYTRCNIKMRAKESEILAKYSQNLGLSKNALFLKCLVYCYDNMIDVSNVKLSTADKSSDSKD